MVLFVLDNEPQPQEERETEAMELENFMDVSSSFCCKTSLFFFGGGEGGGRFRDTPLSDGAECLPVLSLIQLI